MASQTHKIGDSGVRIDPYYIKDRSLGPNMTKFEPKIQGLIL